MWNDQGELILAKLSPQGYEELSRARQCEGTNRCIPRLLVAVVALRQLRPRSAGGTERSGALEASWHRSARRGEFHLQQLVDAWALTRVAAVDERGKM